MRPRKDVLLLMRNEEELGAWRMRIEIWGYRAVVCETLEEAIAWIREYPACAVATSRADAVTRLAAHHGRVLLFDVKPGIELHLANRVEPSGPALPARVREALKVLTALKRGPRTPEKKPSASVPADVRERRRA